MVRQQTLVCSPDKEELFLDIALCGSAAQVETIVKRYRAVELNLDAQHAFDQYEARCLDTYWDEEGCLVINGRLTAEQGALFLKAVQVAEETPAEEAIISNTADRYQVVINVPAETLFEDVSTSALHTVGKAQASIEDGPAMAAVAFPDAALVCTTLTHIT